MFIYSPNLSQKNVLYMNYMFIYSPNLSPFLLYMNCICLYTVQTYHKKMFTVYELYMFITVQTYHKKMFTVYELYICLYTVQTYHKKTVYELYMFIYSPNCIYCICLYTVQTYHIYIQSKLITKTCLLYMNCICLYTVQTYHKKMFTVYELYMFICSPNLSQKNVYCI